MPIHLFGYCLYFVLRVAVDGEAGVVAPKVVANRETDSISRRFFVTPMIDSQLLGFERLE